MHYSIKTDPVTEFFGEVISTYTRAQAIEDGVLVDPGPPLPSRPDIVCRWHARRPPGTTVSPGPTPTARRRSTKTNRADCMTSCSWAPMRSAPTEVAVTGWTFPSTGSHATGARPSPRR